MNVADRSIEAIAHELYIRALREMPPDVTEALRRARARIWPDGCVKYGV